ncbi:MAG: sigma-70 family RNA polymerase sigma factor, partial [Planctomycetes bacterium]|nr:sigma-70 family RNA polymerase sigma factor [Planctomycetota bacterium]
TREDIEEVLQAVDTLPDHYREVITLRYLRDLDGRTMAKLLGEPEGTVRNRLFRALAKLREILQPKATS